MKQEQYPDYQRLHRYIVETSRVALEGINALPVLPEDRNKLRGVVAEQQKQNLAALMRLADGKPSIRSALEQQIVDHLALKIPR